MRWLLVLSLTLPAAALAESDCEDAFLECRDDCSMEFGGSIRVDQKKKFDKCMKKCTKTANRCSERVMEAKAGNLDEGALDGTPTSDQVDKEGLPSSKKKKKKAADPLDEERPDDEPVKKKDPLAEGEVPRSSRTTLKTDDPPPSSKSEPVATKSEPIELKMTPKKDKEEPVAKQKDSAGEDLRDDKPRAAEEPPPKKEKKKEEPPPKKKEEDHDDLRFY